MALKARIAELEQGGPAGGVAQIQAQQQEEPFAWAQGIFNLESVSNVVEKGWRTRHSSSH